MQVAPQFPSLLPRTNHSVGLRIPPSSKTLRRPPSLLQRGRLPLPDSLDYPRPEVALRRREEGPEPLLEGAQAAWRGHGVGG